MHHLLFYLDVWINEKIVYHEWMPTELCENFKRILWRAQILKLGFFQFSVFSFLFFCSCACSFAFQSSETYLFHTIGVLLLPSRTSLFWAVLTYFELRNLNPTCPFAHSDDHLGPSKYIVIYLFTFILLSCLLEATIANWEGVEKVADNRTY
jgi:hypothetical protein